MINKMEIDQNRTCKKMGLEDLEFEAIILRHSSAFSAEALIPLKDRLDDRNSTQMKKYNYFLNILYLPIDIFSFLTS